MDRTEIIKIKIKIEIEKKDQGGTNTEFRVLVPDPSPGSVAMFYVYVLWGSWTDDSGPWSHNSGMYMYRFFSLIFLLVRFL